MATNPIPPGGIVSVPDPSGGGAGAPVIVSQIVNAKWANAINLINRAFALGDNAVGIADPAPQMPVFGIGSGYLPPVRPDLPVQDPSEAKAMYDDAKAEIDVLIQSGYGSFLQTYFPDGAYYPAALSWIERALTAGGTGINVDAERAIWERDRARFLGQNEQARQEALATWANRGFSLPPGALVHQMHSLDLEAGRQLAAQSRDIAIKSWEAELENVRFAVQQAINLRVQGLQAAGDYIRTLVLGPQTAMQLATGLAGLRTDLARALTAMYSAETQVFDSRNRLVITDAQLRQASEEANLRSKNQTTDSRVRAALANAGMVGSTAAASLNGINSGASISGSDSTSL